MSLVRISRPVDALCLIFLLLTLVSCRHNHEVSESLKKAHRIQLEALEISKEVDQLLLQEDDALTAIKQKKDQWLKNMIEIAGTAHDHSNCKHDHSRPTYSVTDEEMIVVQQSWKDSIIQIKKEILSHEK